MINCMCVIQEGQAADQARAVLANKLSAFAQENLGEALQINWAPVAPGNGFTAGQPSTSSVVALTANQPVDQARREQLLRELVSMWSDETGCSVDEVVAVVSDPATH